MNRRLAIIIGISAAVIIIAIAVVVTVNNSPRLQNLVLKVANRNTAVTNSPVATNTTVVNAKTPADPVAAERAAVTYAARNFAEMYGSFTNQDTSNLSDVQVWGTKRLNNLLQQTIVSKSKLPAASTYQAFVTQALVMKITKLTAGAAAVTVSTQRTETVELVETTYTQDLNLELVKTGKDWKVDAAIWRPK